MSSRQVPRRKNAEKMQFPRNKTENDLSVESRNDDGTGTKDP